MNGVSSTVIATPSGCWAGNVVIMLLFVINAVFRGAGDAAIAMRVLIVANLNMALDPLIFGCADSGHGIEGAAIATNIGRSVGCAAAVVGAAQRRSAYPRRRGATAGNLAAALNILHTSLGGIGQMLVGMTAWIFLMRILASVSNEAVAGATIALRIMMFTLMPAWGPSNAAATLGGTESGAVSRNGESSVWKIGFTNMAFMIFVSVIFFFWHDPPIALFTDDQAVIAIGGDWRKSCPIPISCMAGGWCRRRHSTARVTP